MERRNEVDVLHVKMDVKSAQDFLAMVAENGDTMVEVQDLLAFARPWITDWPEHLARLERTAESHDRCTPTELANWNKVSRQTVTTGATGDSWSTMSRKRLMYRRPLPCGGF